MQQQLRLSSCTLFVSFCRKTVSQSGWGDMILGLSSSRSENNERKRVGVTENERTEDS